MTSTIGGLFGFMRLDKANSVPYACARETALACESVGRTDRNVVGCLSRTRSFHRRFGRYPTWPMSCVTLELSERLLSSSRLKRYYGIIAFRAMSVLSKAVLIAGSWSHNDPIPRSASLEDSIPRSAAVAKPSPQSA